ncbi:YqaJ viral recombinase family protein [Streptomyces sp. AC495_CC817]|uniref:YqaJ viral recombinase family nuclease n=1 Tax=Streptomyces sp. AC495_CC817 TaxID=2823900 RepID=UPI001C268866|nr:YqaJ viral recombinase family protein [Streptomyces sp. AC495_CC817]
MSFTVIDVQPDTPEWEQERRNSVGASELAAAMHLSPYATPLDVWKHKQGIDRPFDELLSFIGHESEHIIEKWVHQFSGLDVALRPAFMARSVEFPFIHASFDRVSEDPFTTFQFKTAHHYTGHKWDDGIPTDIRVQVQGEMLVAGTRRAAVVVWIGGREFRLFWEDRDDRFIHEHLIPAARDMWSRVLAGDPPPPSTIAEVNAISTVDRPVELSDLAFETFERITVLNSDIRAQEEERDALKVAFAQYVGSADTLTRHGRKVGTWKQQKGRVGFDREGFTLEHPQLAAKYTRTGEPFRVLRATKQKEQSK